MNWLVERLRNSEVVAVDDMTDMTTVVTMEVTATMITAMVMEDTITTIIRSRDHRRIIGVVMTITAEERDRTTMTMIGTGRTTTDTAVTMMGTDRLLPIRARVDREAQEATEVAAGLRLSFPR